MNITSPKTTVTVLNFLLQDSHACIALSHIKRILPLSLLETVPGSPPYLVGLMNLAGTSVPVIDLSMRLGMERFKPYSLDIPILLCFTGSQQTGIIVDEILGIVDVDESTLQMQNDFAKNDSPFLAIVPVNTELSLFIDIKRIIDVSLTEKEIDFKMDNNLIHKARKRHE